MKSAVISGLGPNGVLAALELLQHGYQVTVIEKRPSYTRPIHLHLRASYLEDVRRLSPELHAQVMEISTPIEENSRVRHLPPGPVPNHLRRWMDSFRNVFQAGQPKSEAPEEYPVRARLTTPPLRHLRLDSAERLFFSYLDELAQQPSHPVTIRRGFILDLEPDGSGLYRASIRDANAHDANPAEDLGCPDLVVLAEGGKSTSVRQLGLESVRFSYPKYFMSAHADIPFGPRTSRVDTTTQVLLNRPSVAPAEVSLWASGHGDPNEGTWIVIEVPEELLNQSPQDAESYFLEGAMLLLADAQGDELRDKITQALKKSDILKNTRGSTLGAVDCSERAPFAGTFKFEQQCLRHPAAGNNVVVLGDAAGMGHHALSSGLEMGACDLGPLGRLAQELAAAQEPKACIARYAEAVFRSRISLLALGMREYYPNLLSDPLEELHRAAELFGSDPD